MTHSTKMMLIAKEILSNVSESRRSKGDWEMVLACLDQSDLDEESKNILNAIRKVTQS